MKLRWFISGKVRQATDMYKHVQKLLNAQRDILSSQAIGAVTESVQHVREAIDSGSDDDALGKRMTELETVANKWIKPYPHAEWRENVEVFLVAIVVAMGIRTFFLQPFKIPTGSMQPTLFGVKIENMNEDTSFKMPSLWQRVFDAAVHGTIYHEAIAEADGAIKQIDPIDPFLHFINRQRVWVDYQNRGAVPITVWLGPDDRLLEREVMPEFHKGDPIFRFKETTGDHLFVDRMTYNFRKPKRGEIVVFKTQGILGENQNQFYTQPHDPKMPTPGIPPLDQTQFYIKRLIGLPGESISIGPDQHARINGQRLDASTPHFENIYGFDPAGKPEVDHYSGHVLESQSNLQSEDQYLQVRPKHYAVFGDNTMNSLDSRYWGDFPQENVIGKAWFVYWPISSRFGWGQR